MSSDNPHSSQSQLYPPQSALSSSHPSTQSYCYPSAIIESLQTGSNTRDIPPTIPGSSQFDHPARRQVEGSFERNPGPPESSLPLGTPSPGQGLAIPSSDNSQTRGDPRYVNPCRKRSVLIAQHAGVRHVFISHHGPRGIHGRPNHSKSKYGIIPLSIALADLLDVWPNRSPRPPTTMDQSMQQSHLLSSGHMGYNPPSNPAQGYYQGRHSGQYFSAAQHEQLRRHGSVSLGICLNLAN